MTKIITFNEDKSIYTLSENSHKNLKLIAEVGYDIDRMMKRYNIKSIKNNSEL